MSMSILSRSLTVVAISFTTAIAWGLSTPHLVGTAGAQIFGGCFSNLLIIRSECPANCNGQQFNTVQGAGEGYWVPRSSAKNKCGTDQGCAGTYWYYGVSDPNCAHH